MTVLVTGGAGYIGSQMLLELRDRGESVVVLDNLSTGRRAAVPADVPFFEGDVGDRSLVAALIGAHGIDTIIHFAASIVVPESVRDPLGYYWNNTVNSRALLAAAASSGVRHFVFSSTAAVYGEPERVPVSEEAPLHPTSPYGSSKMMTEIMLRDGAAVTGMTYVALRYFNVAGADPMLRTGQSGANATHLIKVAVQAALGLRSHIDVYGDDYPTPDGTCVRDYIHVADLGAVHLGALDYLRGGGLSATFNCGYGHGYSVREVIDMVAEVAGVDLVVRRAPRRPGDPASIVADVSRIKRAIDWHPKFDDLSTIVAHALEWERSAGTSHAVPD